MRMGGVVVLFFLAFSDSGFIFLLSEMLVSTTDECFKSGLLREFEVEAENGPPLAEPAAVAPLPASRPAIWRRGSLGCILESLPGCRPFSFNLVQLSAI